MILNFTIKNQSISLSDKKNVVADSKNYLHARFLFSEDWDCAAKTAIFERENGDTYCVAIKNDSCVIPHEVIKKPYFKVSVRGDISANDNDILITVNQVRVPVAESGYRLGATPQPPTPDIYAELLQNITAANEEIKEFKAITIEEFENMME